MLWTLFRHSALYRMNELLNTAGWEFLFSSLSIVDNKIDS